MGVAVGTGVGVSEGNTGTGEAVGETGTGVGENCALSARAVAVSMTAGIKVGRAAGVSLAGSSGLGAGVVAG
jgi:hypothetical protein